MYTHTCSLLLVQPSLPATNPHSHPFAPPLRTTAPIFPSHLPLPQVYLLNKRFKQQQQIVWEGKGGVQDRTIYEDSVFARMLRDSGLMTERDFQTYRELFSHMSNFMRRPNLIVHLDLSPEESLRRIRLRKRECEVSVCRTNRRAFLNSVSPPITFPLTL